MVAERAILAAVSKVYEAWGFEPLETGAFEYADALGKFLPDADRPNEGVFALQDDDEQWMALRYDLTAPLARFTEIVAAKTSGYRTVWRRGRDSNPRYGFHRTHAFQACDLNHSSTSPETGILTPAR